MNTSPEQLSQILSSSFLSQLDIINDGDPIAQKLVDKWYTPIKKPRWYLAEDRKNKIFYVLNSRGEKMISDWFDSVDASMLWDDCIVLKRTIRGTGYVAQLYLPKLQKFASFGGLEAVNGESGNFKISWWGSPGTAIIQFLWKDNEVLYFLDIDSWITTPIRKPIPKELPTNVLEITKVLNITLHKLKDPPNTYDMLDADGDLILSKIHKAKKLDDNNIVITVSLNPPTYKLCDADGKWKSNIKYKSIIQQSDWNIQCIDLKWKEYWF